MSQAVEDERTVLQSIYGDSFAVNSAIAPTVSFSPASIPRERLSVLQNKLTEMWNNECNLFAWTNWLQENAVNILLDEADRKVFLSADDSCGEDSEPESPLASSNEDDDRKPSASSGRKSARILAAEAKGDYTGPAIAHGIAVTDRKSKFIAHAARVRNEEEIIAVVTNIANNRKWSTATHNMWAARFRALDGSLDERSNDDGEHGAGQNLMTLLQNMEAENVLIVVSRWFGGIMLGSDRFRHITNVARELLSEMGYGKHTTPAAETKENKRLRPAEDVLHRIKWDPDRKAEEYIVGYEDRFEGVLEMPFLEFDAQTDIPMHRIRFFKHNGQVVWDRRTKLDLFFTKAA